MNWNDVEYWEIDGEDVVFFNIKEKEINRIVIDGIIEVFLERMKEIQIEAKE